MSNIAHPEIHGKTFLTRNLKLKTTAPEPSNDIDKAPSTSEYSVMNNS